MERGFYNDEFEELLRQKADQHRMYPSDQVWKGIDRSLHTRRKWYWLSFVLFLSAITYYAIVQLISPSSTSNKKNLADINAAQASTANNTATPGKPAVVIPFSTQSKQEKAGTTPRSFVWNPNRNNSAADDIKSSPLTINNIDPAVAAFEARETTGTETAATHEHLKKAAPGKTVLAGKLTSIPVAGQNNGSLEGSALFYTTPPQEVEAPVEVEQKPAPSLKKAMADAGAAEDEQRIDWLQQYAVYELKVPQPQRWSWQLAFTPTMNYRKLRGSDASISSDIKNVPIAMNVASDPDKLVNHKPALGFELGSHFFYALNKTFQLKVGAQFNYSRYAIQAYGSYNTDVATIALNSSNPRHNDSITNLTRIRNFGGDISEDIQNQYFEFSMPVGLQVRILGNEKVHIGVAGTVQPTYLINRNSYLITTDFKNYTREPSLVRKWNVNTSAEIFIAYKTGDLKWQIGPQFRYQLLSSYIKEYPIREYLMEYGIKFGVTKTIR